LDALKGAVQMNDRQLEAAIAARPHDKVTKDGIEKRIKSTDYMVLPNSTVTICSILLENGYSVRGESACVDPRNFDMEIGRQLAYRDAFSKLWPLEGYLLAERRFYESQR
jgi:Phage protein (N4 Gp49/phage Sf6 gene 66) family